MISEQHLIEKLRLSNLRPTKQRLEICKVLFDRDKTFHFTISDLSEILNTKSQNRISLATIYNTVAVLRSKGHLKEISINSDKTFFDTNISDHHHFFNENTSELTDFYDQDISKIKIKKNIPGKKVKSVEVLVKIANNN
tara:strand:- start:371 stop:787 length:417 start_codon:yes stop_codon:yes gene_type:complete